MQWICTKVYIDYMNDQVTEDILQQLYVNNAEAEIGTVNNFLLQLSHLDTDYEIFQQLDQSEDFWTDVDQVVSAINGQISNTYIQRAAIPIIQTAMNQRVLVYTRYAYLALEYSGINDILQLPRALGFAVDSIELFNLYINYVPGAYYDILMNSDELSYNNIISEINMLFNTKLFCEWVYFTRIYNNPPLLQYCDQNICDCDGYLNLTSYNDTTIDDINIWYDEHIS